MPPSLQRPQNSQPLPSGHLSYVTQVVLPPLGDIFCFSSYLLLPCYLPHFCMLACPMVLPRGLFPICSHSLVSSGPAYMAGTVGTVPRDPQTWSNIFKIRRNK